MGFRRSSHAVWECKYHIVWSTKYRKRVLRSEVICRYCSGQLRRSASEHGINILSLEVDIDHIHLYLEVPPQRSISSAVGLLKSLSARRLFKKFPHLRKIYWGGKLWEGSYFVRAVGSGVTSEMVESYIKNHSEKAQESQQMNLFKDSSET